MTTPDTTGCPVSSRAAAFDPFGEAYQRDPAEALRWARDQEPVFYSPALGYWVVARYDDVKTVLRDNRVFSPSIALERITPTPPEAMEVLHRAGYAMGRTLVNEDEPTHMEKRRLLLEPFTPPQLAQHEEMVRQLTREYVDRFVDSGRVDLVNAMFWEIPLTVALHFLGVPEEDMAKLRRYSVAHTVNNWGRPKPEEQMAVAESVAQFWTFAGEVLEKMRKEPAAEGWMPFTIRAQEQAPEIITESYLHSVMMAVVVAAHETTANAAGNALRLLLENRPVWDEVCADSSLIPNAVEECLRISPSIASWRRIVTEDTTLGGVSLPRGAKLLVVMASANQDPRRFDAPGEVDIRREDASEHLAFGYGSHKCLGKNLARMELQIFLEELSTRLPHMELVPDQEFTYLPNTSFRGPDHVWVQWDPSRNPERTDPGILDRRRPIKLGEPSKKTIFRRARVDSLHRETEDVVRVRLTDVSGQPLPTWAAGAHVEIEHGGLARRYTLCGDRDDKASYEIAVLREPGGRGGSRLIHEQLRVGDDLVIRGPRNNFRIDPAASHYLLVAGGIGITPIIAMADELAAAGRPYEIHYAGRARSDMALLDRLIRDHAPQTTLYPKAEGARLDVEGILVDAPAGTQVYACGPDRLLQALEAASEDWPDDTLRVERFSGTAPTLDPKVEHHFEVELTDSAMTVQVRADQTVLEALRTANVDVQSDCEEGLCGACEIPVLAGDIDHRDSVLTRSERAHGDRMMSCCSRAAGDRLILRI
ncbi:cytochrome P450/oxidoreductase [Streptomyces graminofaciens]|uniref:cytochrome P450/oxidoreductase n=1 Tax=Streptomyces graminofaciens TaxID=68212 RepID=UPI002572BE7C|nr:cytochrome P450/oxidoreductase [Streptomyces graminofaciens]